MTMTRIVKVIRRGRLKIRGGGGGGVRMRIRMMDVVVVICVGGYMVLITM